MQTPQIDSSKNNAIQSWKRLSLQSKYVLLFSGIFIAVLFYISNQLFSSEKKEMIFLSKDKYESIFSALNTIGSEAMSVGETDKIAFRSMLSDIFKQKPIGLEKIVFVDKNQKIFAYQDNTNADMNDELLDKENWDFLTQSQSTYLEKEDKIILMNKIVYKAAGKEFFLGFSYLHYNLDHVYESIRSKAIQTALISGFSLAVSIVLVFFVTSFLIKRIKLIHEATKRVSVGEFNTIEVKGNDELSDLTRSFNEMIQAVKERLLMGKYVSKSTIESLQNISVEDHKLGGIREYVTVFFSDVRGFTSFSEKNEPETVVANLNNLLDLQVEIIKKYFGDIDKFVGDEIMAVFRGKDAETHAATAAIEIQKQLAAYYQNKKEAAQLHIGIGINSGDAVSGNIGSKDRMDYTLIGDTVNTGARLCSAASAGEIIVSESLNLSLDKNSFRLSEGFSLNLKNKSSQQLYFKLLY